MPVFDYKGVNAAGKNVTGVVDADSEKGARIKLRKMEVFPTTIGLSGKRGGAVLSREVNLSFLTRVKDQDIAAMTRQMATLVGAHIPLVETLAALVDQVDNVKLRGILGDIREKVTAGGRLADAMAAHPKIFSEIFINMIRAGEASGALEVVLLRLADLTEGQVRLKSKVVSAVTYPIVMGLVGIGIMGFLLTFVVPKVIKIFEDMKEGLPLPTRILIGISKFATGYWYLIPIIVGLVIYGVRRWKQTQQGRELWDKWSLTMPVFGKIFQMVAVARFTRTLSTLLASGVQLLGALDIVKNLVSNSLLRKAIEDTRIAVREGQSIADPLRRSGYFPPIVTHMIAVGERTGELETMLTRVAEAYEAQVETMIGRLTTLLEPLLIVSMGGVVGFIVVSIFMPMLQMSQLVEH